MVAPCLQVVSAANSAARVSPSASLVGHIDAALARKALAVPAKQISPAKAKRMQAALGRAQQAAELSERQVERSKVKGQVAHVETKIASVGGKVAALHGRMINANKEVCLFVVAD